MKSINTGKYRFCRQQIGVRDTKMVLSEHPTKIECRNIYKENNMETGWEYYCEQEVIYTGTQLNESRNPIDSVPTWIRMPSTKYEYQA